MDGETAERSLSRIERIARHVPDPIVIFASLWVIFFVASVLLGGTRYGVRGPDGGEEIRAVQSMATTENVRWIFENMIVQNFMAFGSGVLGIILVIVMCVGVAEHSGLLGALIRRAGAGIPSWLLAPAVVFLGMVSSVASDAGYLILIPLAGLLYASLGKHPLVGMATAFAGVSAGFSANIVPGTPTDVIIGTNARAFAEAQGVPFVNAAGEALNPATMTYFFFAASVFVLAPVGAWVAKRFVEPRLSRVPFALPADLDVGQFDLSPAEKRGLRLAGLGLLASLGIMAALALGPLAPYTNEAGARVAPFLERLVLLIGMTFVICGALYGVAAGTVKSVMDVFGGMVKQMNTMGYVIVLAFFAYNALSLFNYSGLGGLLATGGARLLVGAGLSDNPLALLFGFLSMATLIDLVISGATSKWLLLGPVFIPMLHAVNPAMTPDVVSAAYRVADSVANVITPMMLYAGVVLAFMRRYAPKFTLGELIITMFPFSVVFFLVWAVMLIGWVALGIPLGF